MSTVFESAISGFRDKNGVGNGTGAASAREIAPLGLNAQKVVSKRYSLRDENGEPVETWPDSFADAMDDDLGTPAAVAVLYDAVREGNRQLAAGESATATAGQVLAMLNVLGLDPGDPGWPSGGGGDAKLTAAVDVLVAALLDRRAEARAAKDFAAADAIRDRIKAAGIEIEDTPDGPKWTI